MSTLSRSELSALLMEKNANAPCPRCGNLHFSILGETTLQLDNTGTTSGALGFYKVPVPAVVVGCNNCGYVSMHAIAALQERRPRGLLG